MLAKKCLLVGIFTLLSVSLAIAAPPAVHPTTGEPLVIDCLRGTPDAIDGDLSDWNLEAMTPAVLDVVEQLNSGQDSWVGPGDCSGEFYLLWDDENIYIAAVVKDEKLSMNKSGGSIWNADAIEVFFSTLNAVAGHDEHYQYGFNANNQRWNWCNMDGAGSTEPDYLQIASSVTADGYICEASISYGQMLSLDFSAGNTIGFHPVFDDTDNGDTELQMTWTGREAHDQSLGFGHLFLSAEPPAALPEGWQSQDIGTTGGSAAEGDGTWVISADGADVWGSADQFHYAYVPLYGDGMIVARVVDNGTGSNNWAKGGVMIRQSLEAGSTHALMAVTGSEGGGGAFQYRPAADGDSISAHDTAAGIAPGYWVKLERVGNAISGSYSPDGVEWTQQGDAQTIEMTDPALIGLFVTSHQDGEIRTYTFDNVSLALPEGWQSQDIGTTGGSVAKIDGTWAISADGADIWGNSDQFHYVYRELTGDAIIEARVVDNGEGSNAWAKGGVMIRQSLDPGSINVSGFITGGEGDGGQFQWRPVQGDSSSSNRTLTGIAPPYYVRLVREGNTFTVFMSADGVEWAQQGAPPATVEMTDPVLIGLAVTSHQDGEVRTFTFDNVNIELTIPVTDPNLLIYYDFESGEGEMAIDRSGHKNHGLFMGNPEWATGIFGGCVAIDIADLDYIETVAPLNIVSNTVTVTGWVKHDESPAAWSGILTHRGTTPGCLGLQHNGVELRYMWGADVYWDVSSGLEMPNGEWYFAALAISPEQGKFYLNGLEQTFTNVAPHEPTNFDSLIRVGRDHNDGRIMTSLIDEVRFYNRTLTDVDIQRLLLSDVTAPGDIVKGVPDEPRDGSVAGWPDGEFPWLAVDDDVSTKFLHFRGEVSPTGFVIEPAAGESIVTGLTLTTANDAIERDPISFEISGSNDSIDGPYTLIASGDIVDFAQADALSRFTMNATAISFDNDVAYKYYQVMFPAVRDPGSANSMQIAEVELLGVTAFPAVNILANGGFEDGVPDPWSTYGDATLEVVQELVGAAVPDAPIEGGSCLHVVVAAAGTNFWDAGLQNGGHVFEAGKQYTLSAFLKCSQGTLDINFKPELAADPWSGFGDQAFTMTEEWAEYSITTPVIEADVDPACITFHIAYAAADFWIDDVRFVEVK